MLPLAGFLCLQVISQSHVPRNLDLDRHCYERLVAIADIDKRSSPISISDALIDAPSPNRIIVNDDRRSLRKWQYLLLFDYDEESGIAFGGCQACDAQFRTLPTLSFLGSPMKEIANINERSRREYLIRIHGYCAASPLRASSGTGLLRLARSLAKLDRETAAAVISEAIRLDHPFLRTQLVGGGLWGIVRIAYKDPIKLFDDSDYCPGSPSRTYLVDDIEFPLFYCYGIPFFFSYSITDRDNRTLVPIPCSNWVSAILRTNPSLRSFPQIHEHHLNDVISLLLNGDEVIKWSTCGDDATNGKMSIVQQLAGIAMDSLASASTHEQLRIVLANVRWNEWGEKGDKVLEAIRAMNLHWDDVACRYKQVD